jgi:16S rRNA (cytosine967-C5)-methyltransferase
VPAYAAVSQSVELAREAGAGRASGLVNGVLQSVRRRGAEIPFPEPEADPVGHLVAWGSHPRWLVERWLERFGLDETRRLVDRDNEKPELYLTILEGSTAGAVEALSAGGIEAEPVEAAPDSVRLGRGASARDALRLVPAVVQDPAAALVVRFADPDPEARIIDVCAAPGGKAIGLAREGRSVLAADLSPGRLARLRDNVARLGLADRVVLVAADARRPPFAPADAVLLDAPCTGTGTLRRHPDGRWRISPADLAELEELQAELLAAAAELVRPGGLLVYSTCSLEPEENELQVRRFLADNPGFELDPPSVAVDSKLVTPEGFLNVLPQREGFDGSFAARIRRMAP